MSPLITVDHVGHTFSDGTEVLRDITLQLPRGAFVTFVGRSGVGKSTLLRIVGGLIRPKIGRIINHQPIKTGIVFQRDNLMPWRTAFENVKLPLEVLGVPVQESQQRALAALEMVGLKGSEDSYPAQLSGGMAHRVALARALVFEPTLLLLDEPFAALDALTREQMAQELLDVWRQLPVTVFMVTHNIAEAVLMADEVYVLGGKPGKITAQIPVELARPRQLAQQAEPAFHGAVSAIRDALGPPV